MTTYHVPRSIPGTRIQPARAWVKDRLTCRRCGIDYNPRNTRNDKAPHTHCRDCRHYQRKAEA